MVKASIISFILLIVNAATASNFSQFFQSSSSTPAIVTMISAETASTYNLANASAYCRGLNAACQYKLDGTACTASTFTGWRLPTSEEVTLFIGLTTSTNYIWSRTPAYVYTQGAYSFTPRMDSGASTAYASTSPVYVRCVR